MKKYMNKELVIFGVVLLIGTTFSEETNKKSSDKPSVLRRESESTKKRFEKDEKLNTASQNFLPGGFNNNGGGFNSGFGNGFNNGFGGSNGFSSNGFGNGFSGNGFGTNGFNGGVNNGAYPQGSYASSGAYNGLNYNQNGLAYPFGSSQGNGFQGFQGQGLYSGSQLGNSGVIQGQGFPGGFNSALGGPGGRFQQFNAFGMPFSTQGAIGIGNYQSSGYPGGLYQGQLADRRGNQYIGNGISVGNTIDVGQRGNGRPGDGSAPSGRTTNQPRSRFVAGGQGGQTFGLNYADQPYNILGGGTFGGGPGYPGGIPGGIYRGQNSGVFNQQVDYLNGPNSRYSPSGNRYFQGANSQGVQRIHRFVAPDSNRN